MSNEMFLTAEQLIKLTGRKYKSKQIEQLKESDGIYAAQQQLAHASVTTTEIYAGRKGRKATPTK